MKQILRYAKDDNQKDEMQRISLLIRAARGWLRASRLGRLGLAGLTIGLGLTLRLVPLGLPQVVVKYGGSALWAMMIYWLVAAILVRAGALKIALYAGAIAGAVEFFKLYRAPGLDAFRLTLAGRLLLGRVFSGWDIAVYWLAIGAAALTDGRAEL